MDVAVDYTVDELMITELSRHMTDQDQLCNGMASFIPVAAMMLAKRTHAPNMVWLAGATGLEPRPSKIPASTLEAPLWRESVMYIPQYEDFWTYALNGRWLTKFCVRGAQIDQYGNVNNSVIGPDYHHPIVRLPGTAGMGDMGSVGKLLYIWSTTHNPRTFVPKVDFISCAGYLHGGNTRGRLGLAGGPQLVVTNLCTMDFHPVSKRMRLRTVHPGITADAVQAATGFELVIEGVVPETEPPNEEQVRLIREEIDPDGICKVEFQRG